jgi:hypothetical protein
MGNTQSAKSDNIENSPREVALRNALMSDNIQGGDSPFLSEINVEIHSLAGGGYDTVDDINVELLTLDGGKGCGSYPNEPDSINVEIMSMHGGAGDTEFDDADHTAIYKEIKDRLAPYQAGGTNNEFFKMLEEKLNGVQSETPFVENQVNKFAEALQKGGYMEETETATVTANKLLSKIVQMGGEDSDDGSSSGDSDFTSTEESVSEPSEDSDSPSVTEKKSFPVYSVARQTNKKVFSDSVSVSEDDEPYLLSSSSLETDDINLISYSPSK